MPTPANDPRPLCVGDPCVAEVEHELVVVVGRERDASRLQVQREFDRFHRHRQAASQCRQTPRGRQGCEEHGLVRGQRVPECRRKAPDGRVTLESVAVNAEPNTRLRGLVE